MADNSSDVTPLDQLSKYADVDPKKVIAVDPGRRDFVTAVGSDSNANGPLDISKVAPSRRRHSHNRTTPAERQKKKERKEKKKKKKKKRHKHGGKKRQRAKHMNGEFAFSVSNAEWNDMSGSTRAWNRRVEWLARDTGEDGQSTSLGKVMNAIPSAKVLTVAELELHISAMLRALGRILSHNVDKKKVRRCRFQSYMQRQAALDTLCHRLTNGQGKAAVVVFGAAQCFSGWGYSPSPIKDLKKRLRSHTRLVVLDEHFTSQRCSTCAFREPAAGEVDYRNRKDAFLEPDPKNPNIFGVRWCPHQSCKKYWNRDINAARNIRGIFLEMIRNGQRRPIPFQHPGALSNEVNNILVA